MDIQVDIIKACCCAAISFLLYNTNFIVEYARLLRLMPDKILIDYLCFMIKNPSSYFLKYINQSKDCFLTRLISCPYCLGFWICFLISGFKLETLFVYYVYILLYSLLLFVINGTRN